VTLERRRVREPDRSRGLELWDVFFFFAGRCGTGGAPVSLPVRPRKKASLHPRPRDTRARRALKIGPVKTSALVAHEVRCTAAFRSLIEEQANRTRDDRSRSAVCSTASVCIKCAAVRSSSCAIGAQDSLLQLRHHLFAGRSRDSCASLWLSLDVTSRRNNLRRLRLSFCRLLDGIECATAKQRIVAPCAISAQGRSSSSPPLRLHQHLLFNGARGSALSSSSCIDRQAEADSEKEMTLPLYALAPSGHCCTG
jgi:hypothetical protein